MDAFVKHRRSRIKRETEGQGAEAETSSSSSISPSSLAQVPQSWGSKVETPLQWRRSSGSSSEDLLSLTSSGYLPSSSSYDQPSSCSSALSDSEDSSYDYGDAPSMESPRGTWSYPVTNEEYLPLQMKRKHDIANELLVFADAKKPSQKPPLFSLGSYLMAEVLGYLEPQESLRILTTPLSKEWHRNYASQQELWRVLCRQEPFKAVVAEDQDDECSSSDDTYCPLEYTPAVNRVFGQYRLMYTSFVSCVKYLQRIKEDTDSGRQPSVIDYSKGGFPHFGMSKSLGKFLSRKRGAPREFKMDGERITSNPIGVSDQGYSSDEGGKKRPVIAAASTCNKKPRYANSSVTDKLLQPSVEGEPSFMNLPSSCAIYSIVNWMVAYPDVEGIQAMCVETLPRLLEDEQQRLVAQRVGLTNVVLGAMLRFSKSVKLHIAAFHTIVLLARPLGGREGMLFDNTMAESAASLGFTASTTSPSSLREGLGASLDHRSGSKLSGVECVQIMVDSMRRFESEAELQAMACWAMVNLALVPPQKTLLISLGSVEATINAMNRHPGNYDVQFRALFALINLVPCKHPRKLNPRPEGSRYQNERDILDDSVKDIVELAVLAMKNFCSSATILNRACLVLHNLSQIEDYLTTLLWSPHLYQMLEWAIANHPTDQVLRRSGVSTLHRLQVLLSSDENLRRRFSASISSERLALVNGGIGECMPR